MKKQFFVANWKSNKTTSEAKEWLQEFLVQRTMGLWPKIPNEIEVILCPPFPLLPMCHEFIQKHRLPLVLGAQDISQATEGAYTGLVSGKLLKEFARYVIIGHSESRKYLHESMETLQQKVIQALSVGLQPIYCISDPNEQIPQGVTIAAFEPLLAIGSGHPENVEKVEAVADSIKHKNSVLYVLYGGSVTPENVTAYTSLADINGVLVGGASLIPEEFSKIIQHA